MLYRFKIEATYETVVQVEMTDEQYKAYMDATTGVVSDDDVEGITWTTMDAALVLLEKAISLGEVYPDSQSIGMLEPLCLKCGERVKVKRGSVLKGWSWKDQHIGRQGSVVRRSNLNKTDETNIEQAWYVLLDGDSKSVALHESDLVKL